MNDFHPDDETLSALLDGEADDEARAHVTGCTACDTRLADLRAAADAVKAAAPSPRPEVREAAIRAALLGAELSQPSTLDQTRRRRRQTTGTRREPLVTLGWLGAAAVFLALLVAVPALLGGGTSDKRAALSAPPTSAEVSGIAGAAATTTPASNTYRPSDQLSPGARTAAPRALTHAADLGVQSSQEALDAALRGALNPPAPSTQNAAAATAETFDRQLLNCSGTAKQIAKQPAGALVLTAGLEWKGTAAFAYVYATPGGHTVTVLNQTSCQLLVAFAL